MRHRTGPTVRARLCACVALASAAAAFGTPVLAGPRVYAATIGPSHPRPQISDLAGDANGLNDQHLGLTTMSVSGSADDAAADILSVAFETRFLVVTTTRTVAVVVGHKRVSKKVTTTTYRPDGFRVTMMLSGSPDANTLYDVEVKSPRCPNGVIDFAYSAASAFETNEIDCIPSDPTAPLATYAGQAHTDPVRKSVFWIVPASAFPVHTMFTNLFAQTETGVPAAVLDEAFGGKATYTVGS